MAGVTLRKTLLPLHSKMLHGLKLSHAGPIFLAAWHLQRDKMTLYGGVAVRETKASNVSLGCSLYYKLENSDLHCNSEGERDVLPEAGVSETESLLESITFDSVLPEHDYV